MSQRWDAVAMQTESNPLHRNRKTKIVATLGPATASPEMIHRLFRAGVDVFRLNFSHGEQSDHKERLNAIRDLEREEGRPIAILADMQGPKLRVGTFAEGRVDLSLGQKFRLDLDDRPGDNRRVRLPHPEVISALDLGERVLLDDGKVSLRVLDKGADWLETEVLAGRQLSDRKGFNVPDTVLPLSPLTAKDRRDLAYAMDIGVDWVALSFVQRPEDLSEARRLISGRAALMAKIEKPSAVTHVEAIIEQADGIMVARGDLGVEMPPEDVPVVQKRILRAARIAGKPAIVATQMLESMISAPTPTRAEASDVAAAIYDGADAIMTSAETAMGQYPTEAISMMDRIARRVETDSSYRSVVDANHPTLAHTTADAITAAARQVAQTVRAAAICTYTTSGSTTLRAARERPEVPVVCLTSKLATARRLSLSYAVHAVHTADVSTFSQMVQKATRIAQDHGLAEVGEMLVITAGVPFGTPGNTNVLRIATVGM